MNQDIFSVEEHKAYIEKIKFTFVFNLCNLIFLVIGISALLNINNSNNSNVPYIIALIVYLIAILILQFKQKYYAVSRYVVLSNFVIIAISYVLLNDLNAPHFNTNLWVVLNILFAFFILGHKWGVLISIGHIFVLLYYYNFLVKGQVIIYENISPYLILNFSIESIIVGFSIVYIITGYIKIINIHSAKLYKANALLSEKNELIEAQNLEISTLFKEVHHRIKNNLQIIISLLQLQVYEKGTEKEHYFLKDAINRINSISRIHEQIYSNKIIGGFDLKEHIEKLTLEILKTSNQDIDFTLGINVEKIGSKSTVLCSLLLNELLTNSIKYAFDKQNKGKIWINIKSSDTENLYDLEFSDSGTWKEPTKKKSLGSDIIKTVVSQLKGSYSINRATNRTTYLLKNLDFSE